MDERFSNDGHGLLLGRTVEKLHDVVSQYSDQELSLSVVKRAGQRVEIESRRQPKPERRIRCEPYCARARKEGSQHLSKRGCRHYD
jgi:hypothetical protein